MTKYLFVAIFFFIFLIKPKAQIDTSFWFVAPEVPAAISVNSVGLQIGSYNQAATVYVKQPANVSGINFTITLPANTSTLINLTASQALITSTAVNATDNKGIYISSNNLISVNYIIASSNSQENISLKGTNAIGDDFYLPYQTTFYSPLTPSIVVTTTNQPRYSGFDIVSTEPGLTTIAITPRGNLIGPRIKNNTFVKTLNQGETFSCVETINNNRRPRSVVNGNFNGDAFKDMAIVDDLNNLLFIFLGNGSGDFTEVNNYPLGNAPTKVIAADVNGDSNQDLIVTNSGSHNVSVFLGAGNGNFGAPTNFPTGGVNPAPVSVAADDIDNDSKLDLIVVNSATNRIGVLKGNGLGSFAAAVTYTVGSNPSDVATMDFDNDGDKDLAVTNYGSNNLTVLTGTTPIGAFVTYSTLTVGNNPSAVVIKDFSNDGNEDLAVACYGSARVGILRAVPIGTTTNMTFSNNVVYYATGNNPSSIVTTSVNADIYPDLVTTNYGGNNLSVLTGSSAATGTFAIQPNLALSLAPYSIATDDFDNDGFPDFITTNYLSVDFGRVLGNGTSTLSAANKYTYGYTTPFISDLAGSIISCDKKVAITLKSTVGTPTTCNSFFTDQITNSSKIGMHHVIHKSNSNSDIAYILAPVNSTSLAITSATTTNWLINSGETFTVNTSATDLTFIQTDKPVYVLNVAGNGCKLGGAQIAPAYCAGSYTAGFSRSSADSLFLQVYIRNGYQSTFTLMINSVPNTVPASAFTVVPGSSNNLVGARIYYNTSTIPVGAYCILKNSADLFGFSTQNSSNPGGNLFSQHTSFDSKTFVNANAAPTATICSNTSFTLNGLMGGGPNTGIWTYNGFGTLSGGPTQIINNVYIPNQIDTALAITPTPTPPVSGGLVKLVLTTTGICPSKSDTLRLYVKQQPIVTAGSSSVICSNTPTINLSGNVFGASTAGVWSVQSPGSGTFVPGVNTFTPSYYLSNADTALSQLQFVLTSTNNGFCNAVSNSVTIVINHAPLVKASLTNPIIRCSNNSTVNLAGAISGTTTSTGKWTTNGTGIFVPNQLSLICNYIPSAADIAAGTVRLKLTSTNNLQCKAVSDSVDVVFTQPAAVTTGVDLNSCKNNPVVNLNAIITGTASNTGVWYGGSGTFAPSNTALTPTYMATSTETTNGFVILTFSTTGNGICAGVSDQVQINFQDRPIANFSVNTVCLNQTTIFNDQTINTSNLSSLSGWQWHMGDGGTSNANNPIYTYTTAGTYTAQLIVNNTFNCFDTAYRTVKVYALPTASMSVSRACTGSAQLISFNDQSSIAPPASIPATGYYWDFGGFGFSFSKDTSLIFPTQGSYNITHQVTSNNGCVSTFTQFVNITPRPIAKFIYINNVALSLGANISFIDSSNVSVINWSWDFGNTLTSNQQNPTTVYSTNGSYTVTLIGTDQFGCSSTYTSVIKISNIAAEITQLIPNMISPNNDGKNDIWRLDFIDVFYPEAEIEVYNRWGELLFRSVGYSNAWDGSYKGNPLPVGAYFYTINLHDPKDDKIYKGTVTILK